MVSFDESNATEIWFENVLRSRKPKRMFGKTSGYYNLFYC